MARIILLIEIVLHLSFPITEVDIVELFDLPHTFPDHDSYSVDVEVKGTTQRKQNTVVSEMGPKMFAEGGGDVEADVAEAEAGGAETVNLPLIPVCLVAQRKDYFC